MAGLFILIIYLALSKQTTGAVGILLAPTRSPRRYARDHSPNGLLAPFDSLI